MASLLALEPTTGGAFAEGAGAGALGLGVRGFPGTRAGGGAGEEGGSDRILRAGVESLVPPSPPSGVLPRVRSSSVRVRRGARLQGHLNLRVPELLQEFCPLECW